MTNNSLPVGHNGNILGTSLSTSSGPTWNSTSTFISAPVPIFDDLTEDGFNAIEALRIQLLEAQFVMGKISKDELIKELVEIYNDADGIDAPGLEMSEIVETIQLTKEKFYADIVEHVKAEIAKGSIKVTNEEVTR